MNLLSGDYVSLLTLQHTHRIIVLQCEAMHVTIYSPCSFALKPDIFLVKCIHSKSLVQYLIYGAHVHEL